MKLSLLLLMVRTQWRDRIMTSSFLIGITLQTVLLSISILRKEASHDELLLLALRSTLFTGVSILLFAAMSSLSNEFRYGTFEYTHLGALGWNRVLLLRALATSVISWPAVLGPFLAAGIAGGGSDALRLLAFTAGVFALLWAICFWMTYLLNLSEQPMSLLPVFKYFLLIVGLNLVQVPGLVVIAQLTPTYWILQLAAPGDHATQFAWLIGTSVVWTILITVFARPLVDRKMVARWLSGRNA